MAFFAVDQTGLDTGATAWVLASTALVLIMTPGVGFFYGGMVRSSSVLGTIMQSFMVIGIVTVVWVAIGFSLAFGDGNPYIGGLGLAGLSDPNATIPGPDLEVPLLAFAAFQLMFAIITPALITGAAAERWRYGAFALFMVLWSVLVYAPVAHWLFSPQGWASQLGALDFAGGAVVHANSGAAALVLAARLRPRAGWPSPLHRPHNLPIMLLGATMLWFGWFGFNGGSALAANGIAAVAFMNTQIAAATALVAWSMAERIRFGKPTTLGAASGGVAGLVAITPAAGYVTPVGALAIGAIAGVLCQLAVGLKSVFRIDDSLDVAAVHLGGGLIGSLCIGLFASNAFNPASPQGLFYGGGYRQLALQAVAVFAVIAYSMLATLIIVSLTNRILGNRVSPRDEAVGLDLTQHGEAAYSFPTTSTHESAARRPGSTSQPAHSTGAHAR